MAESNPNARLETFCDGVFAIALTLLIIDIKIPVGESIASTNDLWLALEHLLPRIFAFLLSFVIIFITWVNHHNALKLVNKSSSAFIYANGFLLLSVVIMPFPTALLGETLFTDHAAPAVVLYAVVDGLQAIGWILMIKAALRPKSLIRNAGSAAVARGNLRNAYIAVIIYAIFALLAVWFPLAVAFLITVIWAAWLIIGINLKSE
jgi:uncharacterized membrane protein